MPRYRHEAWHILFDNLKAEKIAGRFGFFYNLFGADKWRTKLQKKRVERWVSKNKSRIKKMQAWKDLFGKRSIHDIVRWVNEVWIDPDYTLELEMRDVRFKATKASKSGKRKA